jgi:hypothetical protein
VTVANHTAHYATNCTPTPAYEYLRANPHRINLGRVFLRRLKPADGSPGAAIAASDIAAIDQTLHLWNGTLGALSPPTRSKTLQHLSCISAPKQQIECVAGVQSMRRTDGMLIVKTSRCRGTQGLRLRWTRTASPSRQQSTRPKTRSRCAQHRANATDVSLCNIIQSIIPDCLPLHGVFDVHSLTIRYHAGLPP